MRFLRIWDYLMRRKPLLVAFFVLIMSGIGGYNFLDGLSNSGRTGIWPFAEISAFLAGRKAANSEIMAAPEVAKLVDNGLAIQIFDENQAPVVKITLQKNYHEARVEIQPNSLADGAYVRMIDINGKLLAGEYTRVYDGAGGNLDTAGSTGSANLVGGLTNGVKYYFPETPKDYTVALATGAWIEFKAKNVKFYSTLDGAEIAEFAPRTETESYALTTKGLKRIDWDETKTAEIMYAQLKRYAWREIENYRASAPEHVMQNKLLDAEKKAEIAELFAELLPEDRGDFAEFIERLKKGGAPTIIYRGATELKREEMIDFLEFLDVRDNEDGQIAKEKIWVTGAVDFAKAGEYDLIFHAMDSDGNVAQKKLTISVSEEKFERPSELPSEERPAQKPNEENAGDAGAPDGAPSDGPGAGNGPTADDGLNDETADGWMDDAADGETAGGDGGMIAPILDEDDASAGAWDTPAEPTDYAGDEAAVETPIENPSVALVATENAANSKPTSSEKPIVIAESTAGVTDASDETKSTSNSSLNEKAGERKMESGAETVLGIVAGIIVICGLMKFISDHYIR